MEQSSRIYVAGHRGLVGSAIVRALQGDGYRNLLLPARETLDLTDPRAVDTFFASAGIDFVFLAAAKVGGILANEMLGGDFIRDNLLIQVNVIDAARRAGVRKLLFLGSSCIYPKLAPQPIREDALLTGPLEPTNEWYAIAKIAGIKLCQAYRRQYDCDFISAMPTNLYGPGDNYDLSSSHVLPTAQPQAASAMMAISAALARWMMRALSNRSESCPAAAENRKNGAMNNPAARLVRRSVRASPSPNTTTTSSAVL